MQLHQLQPKHHGKKKKRVGRGGKRGTFSGHGSKGQKSRAGARIRPGFRGGDNPIWKLFPKQRGSSRRVDIKHSKFRIHGGKPEVINLGMLNSRLQDGDDVSPATLLKEGLIKGGKFGVKILGEGEFEKKLKFSGFKFSKSAREKVLKAGGTIE